jgi:hypothetical protein
MVIPAWFSDLMTILFIKNVKADKYYILKDVKKLLLI